MALQSNRDGHNTYAQQRLALPTLLGGGAQLYSVCGSQCPPPKNNCQQPRARDEEQSKHHVPDHDVRHDSGEFLKESKGLREAESNLGRRF